MNEVMIPFVKVRMLLSNPEHTSGFRSSLLTPLTKENRK